MATDDAVKLVLTRAAAIGGAIRQLREVPSGHLYAQLMGELSLEEYDQIIDVLMRSGLVTKHNHLLTWREPKGT